MLRITVLGDEYFDEETQEFLTQGDIVLELEHSLVSLSKWESIYEKPFLGKDSKTEEEILGYIRAMILTEDYPEDIFNRFSQENLNDITKYIEAKRTATWFTDLQNTKTPSREVVTSELVYYWMIALNIPFDCENWHLNRLLTLIKVCNAKNAKPKKMSKSEMAARNREINAQRKAQMGTKG